MGRHRNSKKNQHATERKYQKEGPKQRSRLSKSHRVLLKDATPDLTSSGYQLKQSSYNVIISGMQKPSRVDSEYHKINAIDDPGPLIIPNIAIDATGERQEIWVNANQMGRLNGSKSGSKYQSQDYKERHLTKNATRLKSHFSEGHSVWLHCKSGSK